MTFADDMSTMTAGDIRAAVASRLCQGAGQPWNEAHGEPVWSVLVAAFGYWRTEDEKLHAFDATLGELLPQAFAQAQWALARDVCELFSALIALPDPWMPSASSSWPFGDWLSRPCSPPDRVDASVAALRLALQLDWVQEGWMGKVFQFAGEQARSDPGPANFRWHLECWKALLVVFRASRASQFTLPWFDLFRTLSRVDDAATRKSQVEMPLSWAWSAFSGTARESLAKAAAKSLLALDDGDRQLEMAERLAETFSGTHGAEAAIEQVIRLTHEGQEGIESLRDLTVERRLSLQCCA